VIKVQEKGKEEIIRINSMSAANASDWLTTIPEQRDLQLTDHQYSVALQMRLDRPLSSFEHMDKCMCGYQLTPNRDSTHHLFLCQTIRKAATFPRHQQVVMAMKQIAQEAGVEVTLNYQRRDLTGDQKLQPDACLTGAKCVS